MKTPVQPDENLIAFWKTLALDSQTMRVGASSDTIEGPRLHHNLTVSKLPRLAAFGDLSELAEYRVTRTIGEGGMGIVRLAEQTSLYRDVAIKTVRVGANEGAADDLLREAWIAGRLEHPNIIPIHALGLDEIGAPMLVMKKVEGVSWAEALNKPELLPAKFRVSEDLLEAHLDILIQVCNAVHFAHSKGIIHRDLKPDNVMLGAFGEVYLLDWGLAASLIDDGKGRLPLAKDVKDVAGTPAYIAPEMSAGHGEQLDERTDVYLLGAVLHELVTGTPRHQGASVMAMLINAFRSDPVAYDEDVPRDLAAICNRATSHNREDRFASAEDFRLALVEHLRNRVSRKLSDESARRLNALRAQIADFFVDCGPGDGVAIEQEAPGSLYELFTECRFGFDQALNIWPGNEDARIGRQAALEVMADFELRMGDEKAATLLIDALSAPSSALLERLAMLREALGAKERALDELKRISHDVDLGLGGKDRSVMMMCLALLFGGAPMINSVLVRNALSEFSFQNYFVQFAAILTLSTLVVIVMRKKLFKNAINTRIVTSLFVILAGILIMRLVGFALGLDVGGCTALENGLLAFSIMMLANLVDHRLWPAAGGFLLGTFGIALFPELVLEIDGASNFIALALIAWAWRGDSAAPGPGA
ncbi:MAG: serine/threonine protein kinase [Bradymonadaceae bacterium]|nr:serine/threonine protein kinase [Lujinxingiaceae bacterium]